MSGYLTEELLLFIKAFWQGAVLVLIYDVFRILRRAVPHGSFWIAAEDLSYWIFCAFFLLGYFYRENSGLLRGYLFAGVLLGGLACSVSISRIFVICGGRLVKACGKILGFPLKKIKKGIKRLKFRVFRFKIYGNKKFQGRRLLRRFSCRHKERNHEQKEQQKQPKKSQIQTEPAHNAGDHSGRVRSYGCDSCAGTEPEP